MKKKNRYARQLPEGAEALCTELGQIYADYIEESTDLFSENYGLGNTLKGLIVTDEIKGSPIHTAFYEDVEACVNALCKALRSEPNPVLAAKAAELLIAPRTRSENSSQYLWLLTAEQLASPLLPLLDRDALTRLHEYYSAQNERELLPVQQDLWDEVKRQLGLPVKKRRSFFTKRGR